ncbi:hypothetical protein NKI46_25070 [Mesorhizobium sp. M0615]|uniref:hypothetical protein n=1 Tax=Mesorhizobium sp. M0615 TaxID=2956971 RepID=UPI00333AF1F5
MATVIAVIGRSMLKRRLFNASRSTDHRPPPLNKKLTADPSTGGKKKHRMEKVMLIRDGETCCLMAEIGVNALVHNALGRVATDNVWRGICGMPPGAGSGAGIAAGCGFRKCDEVGPAFLSVQARFFPAFEGYRSVGQEFSDSGLFMENSLPIGVAAGLSSVVISGGDLLERRHEPIVSSSEA